MGNSGKRLTQLLDLQTAGQERVASPEAVIGIVMWSQRNGGYKMEQQDFDALVERGSKGYGDVKAYLNGTAFVSQLGSVKVGLFPVPQDVFCGQQRKKRGGYDRWLIRFKEMEKGMGGEAFVDVLEVKGEIVDVLYAGIPQNISQMKALVVAQNAELGFGAEFDVLLETAWKDRTKQRQLILLNVDVLFCRAAVTMTAAENGLIASAQGGMEVGTYADF